ncbi:YagK/YfjJ domain-containing protein [Aeromonas hydrophila]
MGSYKRDYIDVDSINALRDDCYYVTDDNVLSASHPAINVEMCKQILVFLNGLSKYKKPPLLEADAKNKFDIYPLTAVGKKLKELSLLAVELTEARKHYKLHPKIELFDQFIIKTEVYMMLQSNRALLYSSWSDFYSKLKSESTIIAVLNFTKGPEKNYRSLCDYVSSLFNTYARLLVLRIDLSYKSEDGKLISLEEVVAHRNALLNNARKDSLAKSWVGYAWRLEFAPKTGYHYHLVVFLDGSKYKSEYTHSENIRQEWKKITEGKGRAYLCNLKTQQYRFIGIGMVDYHDVSKRGYLIKALAYLTKADKIAKLTLKHHRAFGKSCVKKNKTKMGRKRSKFDKFWDDVVTFNHHSPL